MKVIQNLAGETAEAQFNELRGAPNGLILELENNVILHAFLGPAGLLFRAAKWDVVNQQAVQMEAAIPMDGIIALLRLHASEMFETPPKVATQTKAQVIRDRALAAAKAAKAKGTANANA